MKATKRTFAFLGILALLALVLSFSACVQRAETGKAPAKTLAPVAPAAQLSEADIASIETDLSDAELLLSDTETEEQIDIVAADFQA